MYLIIDQQKLFYYYDYMAAILSERDNDYLEERFKDVFATKKEFSKYRSDIMDKLDEILKEVVAGNKNKK